MGRPLSEKNTPKTSVWGSKQVSLLKAVITGKLSAIKPDKNETPEAAKPKDVKGKSHRRGKGSRNRSYRKSKRNRKSRRKETPKTHPVEKPPMPKPVKKEQAVEVRPERVMSVTAVLGGRPRSLSNESEFSRITNKSFRDTVVGEPLLEERRTWGSINEDWEEDLPPQAVADMPVITPTESMMLATFKPFSFGDQSAPLPMTDVSSVSTTSASPPPPAPAVEPSQQAMMHLIPDMMVLPSEPIHGQRMMVPAVWDANHRCFVASVHQSVNTQHVMAPGYQFVYPAIQVAPAPWMYPQMMNSYGQFPPQMEG